MIYLISILKYYEKFYGEKYQRFKIKNLILMCIELDTYSFKY